MQVRSGSSSIRQRRVESCHRKSTAAHPILKWEGVYKVTEIRALRAQQEIREGCVCFETKVKEGKTYSRPPPPTQPDAFWSLGAVPSIWHTQRLGVILMVARVELSFCKACQCKAWTQCFRPVDPCSVQWRRHSGGSERRWTGRHNKDAPSSTSRAQEQCYRNHPGTNLTVLLAQTIKYCLCAREHEFPGLCLVRGHCEVPLLSDDNGQGKVRMRPEVIC